MAVERLYKYTTGRGAKLPGHAKDELIWASDEIERLRGVLAEIADCESHHEDDVVAVARRSLRAVEA